MKTGAFETDTKRAERRLAEFRKEAEKVGQALTVAFTAAAAATALLVRSSLNAADSMIKLSQQTGVSVEALSGFSLAAELSGVETDQLAKALQKLSIDAASGGSRLSALGVALTTAGGRAKTAEELFSDVAEVFATIPDGVQKTAAAVELFGERVGPKLIPLLNGGAAGLAGFRAEAEKLGLVIDADFARAAEQFNDNIARIGKLATGFGNTLAQQLLPALNVLVDKLLEIGSSAAIQGTFSALSSGARVALETITILGANVAFVFQGVGREIGARAAQLRALATLDFSGVGVVGKALREDNAIARRELEEFEQRVLKARDVAAAVSEPRTGTLPATPAAAAGGRAGREQQQISFEELLARGAALREKIGQQEEEDATRLYELQRQYELDLQATRSLAAQARIDAAEQTAEAFIRQQQAEADAIRDRLDPLREYARTLERIAELERGGFLTEGEAVGAVAQASEAFRKLGTEAQKTDDITKSLGLTFSSAFESAIAGGQGLKGALKGLEQDLLRLGTRKLLTEPFLKLFEGGANGSASPASGFLSGLAGSAGSFLSGLIPGFATGTDFVPRTGLALVHQGEKITPAAENRAGMGGRNIVFNISTPDANSFRSSSGQIAAKMALAIAAGQRNI